MRFSLKWMLAAMAYVALAVAAFAKPRDWFTVSLWAASFLAFCYALLIAVVARGHLRIVTTAFALTSAVFVGCLIVFPNRVPWYAIFAEKTTAFRFRDVGNYPEVLREIENNIVNGKASPLYMRAELEYGQALRYQSANAIGTMLAGLVGYGLGALAYRRGRPDDK